MDAITSFFCNENNTPMAQVLISLALGILVSPWSSGLFFLLIFIIIYEIILYYCTGGHEKHWQLLTRAAVINASILGWIIGREVCCQNILEEGVPSQVKSIIGPYTGYKE